MKMDDIGWNSIKLDWIKYKLIKWMTMDENAQKRMIWMKKDKSDYHGEWQWGGDSHWQESWSRKISRRYDSIISLSLEKIEFSVLFLVSIFKMLRKKFSFSSRFMRFFKPFSFSSWFSRFFKNNLCLFSIYEILKQDSLSLLEFSRFWEKNLFLFSMYEIFKMILFLDFQDF